jgi:hypothetical protein
LYDACLALRRLPDFRLIDQFPLGLDPDTAEFHHYETLPKAPTRSRFPHDVRPEILLDEEDERRRCARS